MYVGKCLMYFLCVHTFLLCNVGITKLITKRGNESFWNSFQLGFQAGEKGIISPNIGAKDLSQSFFPNKNSNFKALKAMYWG